VHNFEEIRNALKKLGYTFFSGSDTEVILKAYKEWGKDCLHKFNGMWAFAIWDVKEKKLFLSRDRFGIKPFYYFWDGKTFIFGSEIKAILASGLVKAMPNDPAIYNYLAYGETDYSEGTCFQGIKQLMGGYLLEFVPSIGKIQIERWYALPAEPRENLKEEEYVEKFYELFDDSIRLRLISDVPVGTCLSGGLDSSSIVCMVDKLMRSKGIKIAGTDIQKTFSARYKDKRHDEGEYIDAVVRKTGVESHIAMPQPEKLLEELESLIWHQDEPFGSTSMYAQWQVFKTAKEAGVTVTLDGQGGDETMGGYHHYFAPYFSDLLLSLQLGRFIKEFSFYRKIHGYRLKSAVRWLLPNFIPYNLRLKMRSRKIPSWFGKNNVRDFLERNYFLPPNIQSSFSRQTYLDTMLFLHSLLRYEDRNSMAHSIESRLPFLDHRLVEFSFQIPATLKIQNGTTKMILREGMKDILPDKVRLRQDKIGFSTPEDEWFRGPIKKWIFDVIRSQSFQSRPYFNHKAVEEEFNKHIEGKKNISQEIWRWINFNYWFSQFINK
jgi:asparagine synthase (glutamine-hydrolysing)